MKISSAALIAIACVIGLVAADYGYGYAPVSPGYGAGAGGLGQGGLLTLIGLLFLLMVLFRNNNTATTTTTPVGGYVFLNVTK